MSTITITQADEIIDAIGAYGKVVRTGTDTYLFTDHGQEVTAADIIAGAGNWAADALNDMSTPTETVEIARIVLAGSFDHASVLIKYTHPELGAQIQQRITATAAHHA